MPRHTFTLLAFLLVSFALPSFADTFQWSYTGDGVNASGTFVTDPLTDGTYQITSITGERNGELITGLSTFGLADNLIYLTDPMFDYAGLSFVAGGTDFNIYGTVEHAPTGDHGVLIEGYIVNPGWQLVDTQLDSFTLTRVGDVSQVPEPSSLALLSTGALGLIVRMRKSRRL